MFRKKLSEIKKVKYRTIIKNVREETVKLMEFIKNVSDPDLNRVVRRQTDKTNRELKVIKEEKIEDVVSSISNFAMFDCFMQEHKRVAKKYNKFIENVFPEIKHEKPKEGECQKNIMN